MWTSIDVLILYFRLCPSHGIDIFMPSTPLSITKFLITCPASPIIPIHFSFGLPLYRFPATISCIFLYCRFLPSTCPNHLDLFHFPSIFATPIFLLFIHFFFLSYFGINSSLHFYLFYFHFLLLFFLLIVLYLHHCRPRKSCKTLL